MNIEIASELSKKYEVEIIIARNGQEALELFLDDMKTEIDLIFMDIQMPVMDGYEATRKIRSSQKSNAKTIPIVAMTANAFAEDISLSLASGMNNHLSKPINVAELFEVLTTYLQ
jgi:CheY-like chemotaxis protein